MARETPLKKWSNSSLFSRSARSRAARRSDSQEISAAEAIAAKFKKIVMSGIETKSWRIDAFMASPIDAGAEADCSLRTIPSAIEGKFLKPKRRGCADFTAMAIFS
jgi:hypothetical protein